MDQRNCPKCGGVISKKARLCRHCQFDLSFEHLLTGEKGAIDPRGSAAKGAGAVDPLLTAKRGISIPRVIGALLVIAAFLALPWLTGMMGRPGAPTDLNGLELFNALFSPTPGTSGANEDDTEKGKTGESEPISAASEKEKAEKEMAAAALKSNVPAALQPPSRPGESPGQMVAIALIVVPVLSLIVLLHEVARRNTSIVLTMLPLLALAGVFVLLQAEVAIIGMGFWGAAAGCVAMQIPGMKAKAKA